MTKHETYGDVVTETIEALVADLLEEARSKVVRLIDPETQVLTENVYSNAEYPLEGEIETLLDVDDALFTRAAGTTIAEGIRTGPDFDPLRRLRNRRLLLAHWKNCRTDRDFAAGMAIQRGRPLFVDAET